MLTYCMNVHPGETLAEQTCNLAALTAKIARLHRARHHLPADAPFGVGLRLSADAAAECVAEPFARARIREICAQESLAPFTLNAFPYGVFHGTAVKEAVYRPTWADPRRPTYTAQAATALAALMPGDLIHGSVSTAPLGYKAFNEDSEAAIANVVEALRHLHALEGETGKCIMLAMEPEPGCNPGSTPETIEVIHRIAEAAGEPGAHHLGVCFDTAHAAVEFEDLAASVRAYTAAGIPIAKCQISAALVCNDTPDARTALARYAEGTYLHQTLRRRPDGTLDRFDDLPEALASPPCADAEIRTHFHVPLFETGDGILGTSQHLLGDPALAAALQAAGCTDFEVETYTWDVWRQCAGSTTDLLDGIVEELATAMRLLHL